MYLEHWEKFWEKADFT